MTKGAKKGLPRITKAIMEMTVKAGIDALNAKAKELKTKNEDLEKLITDFKAKKAKKKNNAGEKPSIDFLNPATYDAIEFDTLPEVVKVIEGVIESKGEEILESKKLALATIQREIDTIEALRKLKAMKDAKGMK